jgi:hypothetical protein
MNYDLNIFLYQVKKLIFLINININKELITCKVIID